MTEPSQPDTDSSTCACRLEARAYWTHYISGIKWAIGYVCGDCGEKKKTGEVDGKPHFGGRLS